MLTSIVCEQGHLSLLLNRTAARLLRKARKIADQFGLGPRSELEKTVARLERAEAAFLQGRPLLKGDCPEDLSEPLRAWLARQQPIAGRSG